MSLAFSGEVNASLLVVLDSDSVKDWSLEVPVDSPSSDPDDSALLDGEGLP